MSRQSHKPDPAVRRQVETLAAYGIPEHEISRVVGIDPKTLRKHYRDELDLGETKANAQVAGFLFNAARGGNVTAQIFWLKTRARWKETPSEHWHAVGTFDIAMLTDAALAKIIDASPPELKAARKESR
jgi:ABC-type branched-subunit amino acid transport system substrate-binding protein